MLEAGLPHGPCSLRWADGSELHAEFAGGEVQQGAEVRYVFARRPEEEEEEAAGAAREQFLGEFRGGFPTAGVLVDGNGARFAVTYKGDVPLWRCPAPLSKTEVKLEPFEHCRGEVVALTKCKPMQQQVCCPGTLQDSASLTASPSVHLDEIGIAVQAPSC